MLAFRVFLGTFLAVLIVYTAAVIGQHGWNLLPIFFGDMARVGWPGQFNLDFMGFLCLSAWWTSWRHGFSTTGLGLGVLAFFGGMMFLCVYLLIALAQARGDVRVLLLGARRASA